MTGFPEFNKSVPKVYSVVLGVCLQILFSEAPFVVEVVVVVPVSISNEVVVSCE